jgi:hypothetical protein
MEVSESLAVKHLMKVVTKSVKNGIYYYPFASHHRFKFWFYDRIRRHRSLDQAKVFLKQNPTDANLTIQELKGLIRTGDSTNLLKRMSAYSANITNSDPYWAKRRNELQATFEQQKPATIFFTFSYADNHWHDLHRLMPRYYQTSLDNLDTSKKYTDVLNHPHLVDWYFSFRLNKFLEIFFDSVLECEWRWHRYEWQSRNAIHAHGAARFKNDPGLVQLTTKVYASRLAQESSIGRVFQNTTEIQILEDLINEGVEAEKIIINYTETLLTANNTRSDQVQEHSIPEPHPCGLRTKDVQNFEKDYEEIINCCQRHVCRLNGYCKCKKPSQEKQCRFGYPFETCEKTTIVFTKTGNSVRATIVLKRNDPYLNVHIRCTCHFWRGNVDMQIILDYHAAIAYMVKYATKSETAGHSLNQLFKDVVGPSSNDDNPQSKIRSIMIKSIAGKRDLGNFF